MKFTTALCTVVLAATVSSVAVPEPVANASPWPPCGKRGQPCKRDPEASPWPPCGKRGQPCKRDAEAIAFPWPPCGARGQPCKREPEAHGVARAAEAFAEAIAEPVPVAEDEVILARCEVVGGACYEARKMTRDLADSIALSARDPEAYLAGIQLETRDGKFEPPPF
jgi:hypothetical protein